MMFQQDLTLDYRPKIMLLRVRSISIQETPLVHH
jgi:hypothetical protein